ncbi:hypothetical protein PG989_007022 [Apiospora arundinis]
MKLLSFNNTLLLVASLGGLAGLAFAAPVASELQVTTPEIQGGSDGVPVNSVNPEAEDESLNEEGGQDGDVEIETRMAFPEPVVARSSGTSRPGPGSGPGTGPGGMRKPGPKGY